jgi:hypothetical protein
MNTTIKTIAASLVAVILLANSCTKDVAAPPGATGAAGTNGTNGTNGNANVRSQTDTATTWVSNGTTGWSIYFVDTSVTTAIQNKGTVQVFMSYDLGTTWAALPLSNYTSVTNNYTMGFTTKTDTVSVQWTNTSINPTGLLTGTGAGPGSNPTTIYGSTCWFKIICISASARMANPGVNLQNYAEFKKAFHLK